MDLQDFKALVDSQGIGAVLQNRPTVGDSLALAPRPSEAFRPGPGYGAHALDGGDELPPTEWYDVSPDPDHVQVRRGRVRLQWADERPHAFRVWTRTDLGRVRAPKPVEAGIESVVWVAR